MITNITSSICDINSLEQINVQHNFLNCSSEYIPYCVIKSCFDQDVCMDFDKNACQGKYRSLCKWNNIFEICTNEFFEGLLDSSLFCEVTQSYCKKDNCLNPCNEKCGASCNEGVITSFDASGAGLTYLPEKFGTDIHFNSIESLDLSDNKLSSLPASVEFMSNLSRVVLSGNNFDVFPNLIFVYKDEESSIPEPEVSSEETHHSSLILRDIIDENEVDETKSSSSSSGLGFIPFKLRELYVNDNNLTEIPKNINALKYLSIL